MSTYFVVNRNLTNKCLYPCIHVACKRALAKRGHATYKKVSCNFANLLPCDPCKLVASNHVA